MVVEGCHQCVQGEKLCFSSIWLSLSLSLSHTHAHTHRHTPRGISSGDEGEKGKHCPLQSVALCVGEVEGESERVMFTQLCSPYAIVAHSATISSSSVY